MPPLYANEVIFGHADKSRNQRHSLKHTRVRFCDDIDVISIEVVPEECRQLYWMNRQDYDSIRRESMSALQLALSLCNSHSPDLRGLEHKKPNAVVRRHEIRSRAMGVVLQEQEFQVKTGYSDPEWIASAYRDITHTSKLEAKLQGMKDEAATKQDKNATERVRGVSLTQLMQPNIAALHKTAEKYLMS